MIYYATIRKSGMLCDCSMYVVGSIEVVLLKTGQFVHFIAMIIILMEEHGIIIISWGLRVRSTIFGYFDMLKNGEMHSSSIIMS